MLADDRCSSRIWYCVPLTSTKANSWAAASPANNIRMMAAKRWSTDYLPRPRAAVGADCLRLVARPSIPPGGPSIVRCGEDLDVGGEVLALGLRAHQHEDYDQHQEDRGADHHRHGEAHLHLDGEVGQHRCDESTEDRPLMVDEARGRRPYLGRETLAEIARVLAVDRAGEEALNDEARDDPQRVLGVEIDRRDEDADDGGDEDTGFAAPFVGHQAPYRIAAEHDDVCPEQGHRHLARRPL